MRKLTRYLAIAFAVVAVAITAISPLATSFVNNGHDTDIELRAELVFNSVRDELIALLANGETKQIDALLIGLPWMNAFGGGLLRWRDASLSQQIDACDALVIGFSSSLSMRPRGSSSDWDTYPKRRSGAMTQSGQQTQRTSINSDNRELG